MFYNKPKGMTYTQMAMWVDENAYSPDCDQQKLYEYLYHLCYILAYKWRYFNTQRDYDDFGLYSASKMFQKYASGKSNIKSSLNYIKKVLRLYRAEFCKQFFQENKVKQTEPDAYWYDTQFEYQLQDKCSQINKVDFQVYLECVSRTIYGSIANKIPKKIGSFEFDNIYTSCLLTFLDLITPSVKCKKRLDSITKGESAYNNLYLSLYKIPTDYKPILYHLDSSYSDYILLLVKKVRGAIRNDLKDILYSYYPIRDLYQDLLEPFKDEDDDY